MQSYFFNQAEYIFIVGIARTGNKNIKRCTSLMKLAFLVFQNLILNCGPFKSTLSIPSQGDFLFFFFAPLTWWQYVDGNGACGGRVH